MATQGSAMENDLWEDTYCMWLTEAEVKDDG